MINTRHYLSVSVIVSLLFHFFLFNYITKLPVGALTPTKIFSKKKNLTPTKLTFQSVTEKTRKNLPKLEPSLNKPLINLANTNSGIGANGVKGTASPKNYLKTLGQPVDSLSRKNSEPINHPPPKTYQIIDNNNKKNAPDGSGLSPFRNELSIIKPTFGEMNEQSAGDDNGSQIGLKRSIPSISIPEINRNTETNKDKKRLIPSPEINKNEAKANNNSEMEYFLNFKPYIYIDEDDELGYFRLDFTPNKKAEGIKPLSKDVIFLVDTSQSISNKRLTEFKNGLNSGILKLPVDDKFNVINFTTKPIPVFEQLSPNTLSNLAQADKFMASLRSYGQTDVYNSIKPFVTENSRIDNRPLLLFFLTDGETTVTKNMENSEIIHNITKENKQNIAIFGFSCGDQNNSFLLDFISFRNRGNSLIVNKIEGASKDLEKFILDHSEILVSDLSYRYMGKNKQDTFPINLPHLFKNSTLSIYGTFELNEKEITLQIVGKSATGDRQLITKFRYEEAENANKDLAQRWAYQKVYNLIGQLTDKKDPAIITEIRRLQQKFDLYIPYELPK